VYGANKAAAEVSLKALCETHGVQWTILRPHNVFGVRQSLADPYRNVVGIFMRRALESKPLIVFGDGYQTRQFSPIAPVAEAICHAVEWPVWGFACNVGGDYVCTVNDLAGSICVLANDWYEGGDGAIGGGPGGRNFATTGSAPERPREVKHAICDHDNATHLLGMPPSGFAGFHEALEEMWNWAEALHLGDGFAEPRTVELELEGPRVPEVWR
jgi:UDP-glucose 4-epimerase